MFCPSCDESFNSEKGMKIHHSLSHGVSIAKEESTCVNCGDTFQYYPSNSYGKICSNCGKDSEDWNESMQIIRDEPFNNFGSNKSKGKDGPSYQRKRINMVIRKSLQSNPVGCITFL